MMKFFNKIVVGGKKFLYSFSNSWFYVAFFVAIICEIEFGLQNVNKEMNLLYSIGLGCFVVLMGITFKLQQIINILSKSNESSDKPMSDN